MNIGHRLLICTVGGTPDPIRASIRHWKPARVLFLASEATRKGAEAIANDDELVPPGAWDVTVLRDAENFRECVRRMRGLAEDVERWRQKGEAYGVVVDFTGGTKCMSAALSLVAQRWPCTFSYVGGDERTKGGTGIVLSGSERAIFAENPWDALGYQAIDDACLLFDRQAFVPAAKLLADARSSADDHAVKRTLSTLHQLCEAYALWDRFQHKDGAQRIEAALKNATDLHAVFGATCSEALIATLRENHARLGELVAQPRSRAMVADLLANADRRRREARYDDGVARLYRAIESLGQLALAERHAIPQTDDVALERVPEPLREEWSSFGTKGKLKLGLQDAFRLLHVLGDEIGDVFRALELHDLERSPLSARNQSILAHGFHPVGEPVFRRLWDAAMKLGGFSDGHLARFPRLGGLATARV
jgi:CRISPR-associated protein (TIGR02710 family)